MTKIFKVAKVSELKDGQMKEVGIPGTEGKILLSRIKGSFYATGSKCTRKLPSYLQELLAVDYGAALKNGVLTDGGRLVCPWHGITF
jgi:apoptosis-inducing factor 3